MAMASPASDAEVTAAAVSSSFADSRIPPPIHAQSSRVLKREIEAPTPSDEPVESLQNDEVTATGECARVDEAVEKAEIGGGKTNTEEHVDTKAGARDYEKVARDLDMLADTVRSIVTDVVRAEAALADEEFRESDKNNVLMVMPDDVAVSVDMMRETASVADLAFKMDKPSGDDGSSAQVVANAAVPLPDTAESTQEMVQDDNNADYAARLPSPDPSEIDNDAPVTEEAPAKRPAASKGKSIHSTKRQKRAEYAVETRALCVHRHQTEGASYATISKELGIPRDTVRAIVRKAKRTGSVVSAPRSGRPRKTSGVVDKVILEAVRSNTQCSAKSIQEELFRVYDVKLSPETVRRRVLEHTKQRIQSISIGTSSEMATSSMTTKSNRAATSDAVLEVSTALSQGDLAATDTSLIDSVSFQQSLRGEGHTTCKAGKGVDLSVAATSSATDVTTFAITMSKLPPQNSDVTTQHQGAPQQQSAMQTRPDEKSSTQKRQKRAEYSIEMRERCVSLHAQGQGYRRIGKALNMPHTTVRAIVEKVQRTGSVLPAKRSGRPRKTDAIVDKVILQAVKANEKSSARIIKEQLQAAYGVRVSCETIRRRVKDHSRQCMLSSTSSATLDMLPGSVADTTLSQESLVAAMPCAPSMPVASLMTFDENGVHL